MQEGIMLPYGLGGALENILNNCWLKDPRVWSLYFENIVFVCRKINVCYTSEGREYVKMISNLILHNFQQL